MSAAYQLPTMTGVLSHFPVDQTVVRDQDEDSSLLPAGRYGDDAMSELLLNARIRSGDYMVTLATELDAVVKDLSVVHASEAAGLEKIVAELLYLDRNYKIVKK